MCVCASVRINACTALCVCACVCVESSFHGHFRSLYLIVPHSKGTRREEKRERDGEIMGMEGERRLTQSLMSFLGSLRLSQSPG